MIKVICHIKTSYAPGATSGADIMCERINSYLASKGCEVICVVDKSFTPYEYKGVKVVSSNVKLGDRYAWADVIITHLINRSESTQLAKRYNKPLFHVCHNDNISTLSPGEPNNYVIYNSHHLRHASPVKLPGIVVNPPTWGSDWEFADHYSEPYHTLVNCVENKGGEMLYQLASTIEHMRFMGIRGGYGQQVEKSVGNGNLKYVPFTDCIKSLYAQTRVLLVPSIKESWSLTAAEAQFCGIPVVCSDLPGLRENLGNSALYAINKRGFIDALYKLQDKTFYAEMATAGRANAESKNYTGQLDSLLNFMSMKAGKEIKEEPTPTEKVEIEPVKEKKEFTPFPEKRKVGRPSTKK